MCAETTTSMLQNFEVDLKKRNDRITPTEKVIDDPEKQEGISVDVGVGGLCISNIEWSGKKIESVLMYKRYKDPEINQWSLLGGHVSIYNTCEDTLKKKIKKLTSNVIQERDIEIQDIITVVNHFDKFKHFHYVSPQYYVAIKQNVLNSFALSSKIEKKERRIVVFDTSTKLKNSMKKHYDDYSTKEQPLLAWITLDVFRELNETEREQIFIHTTIEAINAHNKLHQHLSDIQKDIELYKSWHIK